MNSVTPDRLRVKDPAGPRHRATGLGGVWHTAGVVPACLLPHLRQAHDLADRSYAEPLDLDALAGAAHVSRYHFARCFADTYGETPMRYLSRRRIERAQDLLRSANLTITEVCMLVGFSSLGSFSSRFRELVGESPRQYRDRWATRDGPYVPGCFLFMRGVDRSSGPGVAEARAPEAGRPEAGPREAGQQAGRSAVPARSLPCSA